MKLSPHQQNEPQQQELRLIPQAQNIVDRINLALDSEAALSKLSSWMEMYVNLNLDEAMSFHDHEMQIDIVNDTCARQVVRKCSQVGLTTIFKLKALAVTMISKSKNVIYVGPTVKWASKFAKTELKPCIDNSPILAESLNKQVKSVDILGLGSSFLWLGGTADEKQGAISVPAYQIYIDELDFCNLKTVTAYESRFGHAALDQFNRRGVWIKFCTSTLPNYGIDKEFQNSDRKFYHVKCSECETWVCPDYFRDFVLPGYNCSRANQFNVRTGKPLNRIANLTPEILDLDISQRTNQAAQVASSQTDKEREDGPPPIDINAAYIRCNTCHTNKASDPKLLKEEKALYKLVQTPQTRLDDPPPAGWSMANVDLWKDLCDPKKRKWIATNPGHIVSGRHVSPWDVPNVNNVPSVLMAMQSYRDKIANYYNFTLGLPYADANNSFLASGYTEGGYSDWLPVEHILASADPYEELKKYDLPRNLCLGTDVGKSSNLVLGYREDGEGLSQSNKKLHVIWFERFKSSADKLLSQRIVEITKVFSIQCSVTDAAPDFSTVLDIAGKLKVGKGDKNKDRKKAEKNAKKKKLVLACEYTGSKTAGALTNINPAPIENSVRAYRTGTLTDLMRAHNAGKIMYPHPDGIDLLGNKHIGAVNANSKGQVEVELDELKVNMDNTKKLVEVKLEGEESEKFVNSGPDHYCHALNYLSIACDSLKQIRQEATGGTITGGSARIGTFKTQPPKPSFVVHSH